MRFDVANRRSSLHAFTAWLCVVLHLGVFIASSRHFHGIHDHEEGAGCCVDSAGPARAHGSGHAVCPCASNHADRGDNLCTDDPIPDEAPRDGRDPDGCCICEAIFALQHASPVLPVLLIAPSADAPPIPLAHPQARSVAALWHRYARGPPALVLVPSLHIV